MAGSAAAGGRAVRVEIRVELKPDVEDAEAESIAKGLELLGVRAVRSVRLARLYELTFEGVSAAEAERRAHEAVERLLANPVIHRVTVTPRPE